MFILSWSISNFNSLFISKALNIFVDSRRQHTPRQKKKNREHIKRNVRKKKNWTNYYIESYVISYLIFLHFRKPMKRFMEIFAQIICRIFQIIYIIYRWHHDYNVKIVLHLLAWLMKFRNTLCCNKKLISEIVQILQREMFLKKL